ncbi:hypothetical protein PRIPAC_76836 [Pristionchus pacificus]|uniref:Uncharacterized protein n=1 Tax=Pristionchus pacificus TaxID=54126 RepID=A0A2A6C3M0_PRIPA|nr:hypothetical protein PRIPAC_76836 [Pristionchus pacificus]|eukprot:PDM72697.1 hypothetical protein PRIPAC_39131 [Pristionchus pacificus]
MSVIPSRFLANSWSWESGEGVDEYFKAKGTPWFIRKLILAGSHSMTWNDLGGLRFNVVNKAVVTLTFECRLGEEFTAKVYDKSEKKKLELAGVVCTRVFKKIN